MNLSNKKIFLLSTAINFVGIAACMVFKNILIQDIIFVIMLLILPAILYLLEQSPRDSEKMFTKIVAYFVGLGLGWGLIFIGVFMNGMWHFGD